MKVFIENEAGSNIKNIHDEKTLEHKRQVEVSRAYPFPYGFVLDTTAPDGGNLDCFVITERPLETNDVVECEAMGLMEQIEDGDEDLEDGDEDHNVLASPRGEDFVLDERRKATLIDFVRHVFDHIEGKQIRVGRFLGQQAAIAWMVAHQDRELSA